MNTKHIIALVTFVVAFTGSAILVKLVRPAYQPVRSAVSRGCSVSTAQQITQLIEQDVANGEQRVSEVYYSRTDSNWVVENDSMEVYAFSTQNYVSSMDGLNYQNLPQDFQDAWLAHKEAWRNHSEFLNDLKDISGSEISDLKNLPTLKQGDKDIDRTWFEVLRIARKYNATIPRNAY